MTITHSSGDDSRPKQSRNFQGDRSPGDYKEFAPTSWAIDHGTSVGVLLFFIIVLGVFSYRIIPRESFPEIEIPTIAINTVYPGVSPELWINRIYSYSGNFDL